MLTLLRPEPHPRGSPAPLTAGEGRTAEALLLCADQLLSRCTFGWALGAGGRVADCGRVRALSGTPLKLPFSGCASSPSKGVSCNSWGLNLLGSCWVPSLYRPHQKPPASFLGGKMKHREAHRLVQPQPCRPPPHPLAGGGMGLTAQCLQAAWIVSQRPGHGHQARLAALQGPIPGFALHGLALH